MATDSDAVESLVMPSEIVTQLAFPGVKGHSLASRLGPFVDHRRRAASGAGDFYYRDQDGEFVNGEMRYRCDVSVWNRLLLNGAPLGAYALSYYFSGIQWSAGRHWPIYSTRCPRSDTRSDMLFPDAPAHALIVQFGGRYWSECANANIGTGAETETDDVFVGVNDQARLFGDNTGSFTFVVRGYAFGPRR